MFDKKEITLEMLDKILEHLRCPTHFRTGIRLLEQVGFKQFVELLNELRIEHTKSNAIVVLHFFYEHYPQEFMSCGINYDFWWAWIQSDALLNPPREVIQKTTPSQ